MGDSDDENFATFGSALEPLDEENLPRKKAITVEEQYALDPQGRRRFHGAFTGGFSAGYFNSVGTRDGWRPQQFKSSRASKADGVLQRPEDFMDEEDTSEFGIAPTAIRASSDFTNHERRGAKRERQRQDNDGPIPGVPVLRELLKPVKDTVGVTLLKKMGWRPGQGIGPRITKSEKIRTFRKNEKLKVYGCSMPNRPETTGDSGDSGSELSDDPGDSVLFAPDDYEPFVCNPKDNYFGIGYAGLDRRPVLSSHVNLFEEPTSFKLKDKNKKLSIRGQAFGVGAFEADDEDIYQRDDMSRYDFSLGPAKSLKPEKTRSKGDETSRDSTLEGFVPSTKKFERKKLFEAPELPKDFKPVHAIRKSRFFPPIEPNDNPRKSGLARHDLTANDRAKILGDSTENLSTVGKSNSSNVASNIISRTLNLQGKEKMAERTNREMTKPASWLDKLTSTNFVSGGIEGKPETSGSLRKLEDFQNSGKFRETFKPFVTDHDKQLRFEKFVELTKNDEIMKFSSIQPLSMTEWEREHERDEFLQAARILEESENSEKSSSREEENEERMKNRSADPTMRGKFVESGAATVAPSEATSSDERMKNAARMKLFGKLTRERDVWQPASIVCKRFNVPEPRSGCPKVEKRSKNKKFSVFDSLEFCETSSAPEKSENAEKFENSRADSRENARADEAAILSPSPKWTPIPPSAKPSCLDTSDIVASSSKSNDKIPSFEASYEKVFGDSSASNAMRNKNVTGSMDRRENSIKVEEDAKSSDVKEVEKKDLFKAIFLSSSEDSGSENGDGEDDSEAVKSSLIGKKPGEFNLQRNTSPPRGIFAKLDLDDLTKPTKIVDPLKNEEAIKDEKVSNDSRDVDGGKISSAPEVDLLPDMYGPVLPKKIVRDDDNTINEEASSSKDLESSRPIFRSVVVTTKDSDVTDRVKGKWVERSKIKKSKKDKHKHKHKERERSRHRHKSKKSKR